ncbi:MAG: BatD family protein [Fusobacterium perfoetens]|uniref:BatD family protein n=1 Tax=Fusobacterium perfoetens TaxID=852 RepID=UPI0023F4F850|nr:BatD family protein [Fusobacterium perfoetens]MCI6152413.1 BatD family protein [Fusobacterium perfoetens]MDY3237012.1 BatD family protein [Fusobacterium perfoetens]
MILKIDGKFFKMFSFFFLLTIINIITFGATLTVDNPNARVGVPIKITVEFTDEKRDDYKIEGIENFQSMGKSSRSQSSWINGKSSKSYSEIYTVLPLNEGVFDLALNINGKKVSDKVTVNVSKNNKINTENSYVTTDNSQYKREYYMGEKIPYFEKLIVRTSLNNYGYTGQPVFTDFNFKDLTPRNNQGSPIVKRINTPSGEALEVLIKEGVLEANFSGEKNIVSGLISYTEAKESDFFNISTSEPKYVGGKDISIKINSLPEEGKPNNFQNIVGSSLKGEANWDNKTSIDVGQSFVLRLRLYGDVNLESLNTISFDNQDFNIYQSITNYSEKIINGKYEASKDFEIAFIPRKNGKLKIPDIKISYFDVNEKKYKDLVIEGKNIEVLGEPVSTVSSPKTPVVDNTNFTPTPVEKNIIEITTVPTNDTKANNNLLVIIGVLGVIVIIESGIIVKLLYDKKRKTKNYKDFFKNMKNSKDDKEFYENYCIYMKEKYNFSPKAHFEDILLKNGANEEILEINRYISKSLFKNEKLDYNKIINVLRKNG